MIHDPGPTPLKALLECGKQLALGEPAALFGDGWTGSYSGLRCGLRLLCRSLSSRVRRRFCNRSRLGRRGLERFCGRSRRGHVCDRKTLLAFRASGRLANGVRWNAVLRLAVRASRENRHGGNPKTFPMFDEGRWPNIKQGWRQWEGWRRWQPGVVPPGSVPASERPATARPAAPRHTERVARRCRHGGRSPRRFHRSVGPL